MINKNNDIHNFKILTIYSTIAYLVAYLVVFLSYNIITAAVANLFDIKTIIHHNKLLFLTNDNSPLWTFNSVLKIFGSGTFFLLIVLFILIKIYKYYGEYEGLMKTFLFWIILHIINRIAGLFIIGAVFNYSYSNIILNWLYVDFWPMLVIVISTFLLLLYIGRETTFPLLLSAKSFKFVEDRKRLFFVWTQAFKVWFISGIVIFILHLPSISISENFLSITMLILIIPSYFNYQFYQIPLSENENEEPEYKFPWLYLILTFVFITLFRTILT